MRSILLGVWIFAVIFSGPLFAQPPAPAELETPYLSFLRTSEAELLYERAGYLSEAKGKRNEAFLDEIAKSNFTGAEKLLLATPEDPYSLLNLMLLYLYLDEKEKAVEIFSAWQRGARFNQKVILIEILAFKPGGLALQELALHCDHPSLRHYALYRSAVLSHSPGPMRRALYQWEESFDRAIAVQISHDEAEKVNSKETLVILSQASKELYLKARLDWAIRTGNRPVELALRNIIGGDPSFVAALQASLPAGLSESFWKEILSKDSKEGRLSADLYTRYFMWLLKKEQWEELQRFSQTYRLSYLRPADEMKTGIDAYRNRALGARQVVRVILEEPENFNEDSQEEPSSLPEQGPVP